MPMMYTNFGFMGLIMMILMMLIPLALLGLVIYWAVNRGVKDALKLAPAGSHDLMKPEKE